MSLKFKGGAHDKLINCFSWRNRWSDIFAWRITEMFRLASSSCHVNNLSSNRASTPFYLPTKHPIMLRVGKWNPWNGMYMSETFRFLERRKSLTQIRERRGKAKKSWKETIKKHMSLLKYKWDHVTFEHSSRIWTTYQDKGFVVVVVLVVSHYLES